MKPSDFYLPEKFQNFYPSQVAILSKLFNSESKYRVLVSPTGSGKTLIYMTLAKMLDCRVLILVGSRSLQDLIYEDFSSVGLVTLKGKQNYRCVLDSSISVRQAACQLSRKSPEFFNCDHLSSPGCLYYDALGAACRSQFVCMNYAVRLTLAQRSLSMLGKFEMIVLDEAHKLDDQLTSHSRLQVNFSLLRKWFPGIDLDDLCSCESLTDLKKACSELYPSAKDEVDEESAYGEKMESIKSLGLMATLDPDGELVFEKDKNSVSIVPKWPKHAMKQLCSGSDITVMTSATMTEKTADILGIREEERVFIQGKSIIPSKNRTVRLVHKGNPIRIDFRMTNEDQVECARRVSEIIDKYPDQKGIVSCRSFDWGEKISRHIRDQNRLVRHGSGQSAAAIKRFKKSEDPLVLVSPSVVEGEDFPDKLCRFLIIWKIPFPDMRASLMQARKADDPTYSTYLTSNDIEQMAGRAVRGPKDYCDIYIMDGHWTYFKKKGIFTRDFKRTFAGSTV